MQQDQEQEELLQEENSIVINQTDSSDEVICPILQQAQPLIVNFVMLQQDIPIVPIRRVIFDIPQLMASFIPKGIPMAPPCIWFWPRGLGPWLLGSRNFSALMLLGSHMLPGSL